MSISKLRCKSLSRLSTVAEQFMIQDWRCGAGASVMTLLQVCLDALEAYKEEYKKLKREGEMTEFQICGIYESAYVYYKIVHNLVLNRIANLNEFHSIKRRTTTNDRKLMEIYNMLVKSLIYDEKISEVKTFIKKHSYDGDNCSELQNGGFISAKNLEYLLNTDDKVLLIDVRQRSEFEDNHIKAKNIICIEPISFKTWYTDFELEKKSMITSPNNEIDMFKRRDEFKFIVLYSDGNKQNLHHSVYIQQEMVLLDLLTNRSFSKPLSSDAKVLVLEAGISSWKFQGGECVGHEPKLINQNGGAVYINNNSSAFSMQQLPRLKLDVGASVAASGKNIMISNPQNRNTSVLNIPSRQVQSASPVNLIDTSSSASPPLSNHGDMNFAKYPSTPKLLGNDMSNGNGISSYSNISPINSRAVTPSHRSFATPNGQCMLVSNSTGSGIGGTPGSSSRSLSPQPLPLLPQLPQRLSHSSNSQHPAGHTKQYDLDFTVGLENMGNSCYINCIIQCLLGTHELTNIFLNNSYERHINLNSKLGSKGVLAKHFARLIHQMHQNGAFKNSERNKAVRPYQFKMACGSINSLFKDSNQQDTQEFCQFLLDGLHEDLNQCGGNPPLKELSQEAEEMREKLSMRIASSIEWERYLTRDFSVIVDLFQGQFASQLKCRVCKHTSTTYQPFSVLAVPVPRAKSCYLLDCFREFTKIEQLEKDEEWSCPRCKKKQPSTKKLTITRLPRNLIIHLKRFDNMLNKNNVFVNYPFLLDLTPFWANDFDGKLPPGVTEELPSRGQVPPFKYKLYAVASHTGSLYGGHYTAYVDKGLNKGWYYFEDTGYRPARTPTECITSNAYVLFYHRVYGV